MGEFWAYARYILNLGLHSKEMMRPLFENLLEKQTVRFIYPKKYLKSSPFCFPTVNDN